MNAPTVGREDWRGSGDRWSCTLDGIYWHEAYTWHNGHEEMCQITINDDNGNELASGSCCSWEDAWEHLKVEALEAAENLARWARG